MNRIHRYLAVVLLATAAWAQSVDDIIAKHIAARGGADKIKSVQTRRVSGTLQLANGAQAQLVTEHKRPNRMRMDFITGGLTNTRAFDGVTGWHFLPFTGEKAPKEISGSELQDVQDDSDLDGPFVDYKTKGNKIELVPGDCTFDGKACYHLKVTLHDGAIQHHYLDRQKFLVLGMTKASADGMEVEGHLRDYRAVNGLLYPFDSEISEVGQQGSQKYTVEKIEINIPIGDARFKMPPAPPTGAVAAPKP